MNWLSSINEIISKAVATLTTATTQPSRAFGADVSSWQNDPTTPQKINWSAFATKAEFVFIRCLMQNGLVDSDFQYNWTESKKAGLPRGAYAYLAQNITAVSAAQRLVTALNGDFGELPIVADYEYEGWSSWGSARQYLKDFLLEVERLTGKVPMIYTSISKWTAWGSTDAYWLKYPLWVANYNVSSPAIPKPWTTWLFWQYGTPTINPADWGVESKEIDADYFNGTSAEFLAYFGLSTPEPPPVDPPEIPEQYPPVLRIISMSPEPEPGTTTTIVIEAELADGDKIPYALMRTGADVPPVEPPPTPPPAPPFPHLYKILDDLHAPANLRPGIRNATACTVRMKGVSSSVRVPQKWVDYLRLINSDKGFSYLFNQDSGWHNGAAATVGEPFDVETILMAGNIIEVTRIEGEKAYFNCVHPGDSVPGSVVKPLPNSLHRFIHLFSIQYPTYLDMEVADKYGVPRYPRILPMVPDGQTPWVEIGNLERLA